MDAAAFFDLIAAFLTVAVNDISIPPCWIHGKCFQKTLFHEAWQINRLAKEEYTKVTKIFVRRSGILTDKI
jgi:hypothetical protein